jgi:hypothetical protein
MYFRGTNLIFYVKLELADYLTQISNNFLHKFSSERDPSLWQVIPVIEELQTAWEDKLADSHFKLYHEGLGSSLDKLRGYYIGFDKKPVILWGLGACFQNGVLFY